MMSSERFRRILLGTERGGTAWLWRGVFRLVQPWYATAVEWRNRRFDQLEKERKIFHAGVPTVSVGNLTLGGTGKTPLVLYLARFFLQQGCQPAILSRGYRKMKGMPWNDEGLEIQRRLPEVWQFQNPDRVESARKAVRKGAQILLLDDGFQHRKLARDGNLLLLDASAPWGINGKLFPLGTLRENPSGIRRADGVILTHADALREEERETLRETLWRRFSLPTTVLWAETVHRPVAWETLEGKTLPLETFAGKKVGVFSAVAAPEHFHQTLALLGISGRPTRIFPDHHRYSAADRESLLRWREAEKLDALLCTGKDMGKIAFLENGSIPVFSLQVEMSFLRGEKEFSDWLKRFLTQNREETFPIR